MQDAIDWVALKSRCMNDANFVREMASVFKTHAIETHRKLIDALKAGDLAAAKKYAHTLKGSAANLSAEPLRAAAYAVELESKNGNASAAIAALAVVSEQMQKTIAEIDSRFSR